MRWIFIVIFCTLFTLSAGCKPAEKPTDGESAAPSGTETTGETSAKTTEDEEPLMEIQVPTPAADGAAGTNASGSNATDLDASEPLEEAIERDFTHAMARALEQEKTDPGAASRAYQVLTSDYPNRFEPYHRLALLAEAKNDDELAIAMYEEAERKNPKDAGFFNDFGWYLYTRHEFSEAAVKLRQADSLAPNTPKYQTNLAMTLAQTGNYDGAFLQLQKVQGAKAASSYTTIGAIQFEQGVRFLEDGQEEEAQRKFVQSRETIQKALALDPELKSAKEIENFLNQIQTPPPSATEKP